MYTALKSGQDIKIITHNGVSHLDECSAIQLLSKKFNIINIERRPLYISLTDEEINNPNIVILDKGRQFDTSKSNFDHHQDASLPATNMLILREFGSIEDNKNYGEIFNEISDIDVGNINPVALPNEHFSRRNMQILNSFGIMETKNKMADFDANFYKCLDYAAALMEGELENVSEMLIEAEKQFSEYEKFITEYTNSLEVKNGLLYELNGYYIPNWQRLEKKEPFRCMITRNIQEPEKWQLVSVDVNEFIIPATESQTFRHSAGFMAVYDSFEDAEAHFLSL